MIKKRLTAEQVIYVREHYQPGHAEFGIKALAKKLEVSSDAVKDAVHGKTYKDVGGPIHDSLRQKLNEQTCAALIADYQEGMTVKALAEKYNLSATTVLKYAHVSGKRNKRSRSQVTDEVKAAIIAEYVPYSDTHGRLALAKKYNLSPSTVGLILKDADAPHRTRMTDELKEAIIIAHDEEQLSIRKLADKFGINRLTIVNVLKEAGVEVPTRHKVNEDRKDEVIELYKTGDYSLRQLEEMVGISRTILRKWTEGIIPKPKKVELTDQVREQIYRLHSQGYGVRLISKDTGVSQPIVRKVIDGLM